ncbi:MAG TPA: tRNA guanosine(15) transglycosylase TgtA [Candidatus Acidoferrum sp.]|nr:tRNA guanosine(15) transglycosylase TgtA [Candidatus Acidoferrum sp.]
MSFEISQRDVLGRIGTFETKSGKLETPALFPVVNPLAQEISPRVMFEVLGCRALITNAYLIGRRAGNAGVTDIHSFLDFPGVVATDSGAYQILRYGEVEINPLKVIQYQESVGTDIGVILDFPTGSRASKAHATWTVKETIKRADEAQKAIRRRDIAWVGPIQGGTFPDLVTYSAREMAKRRFDIYALGSPTEVMEQYLFADLADMIFAAKMSLPSSVPFHLFGAGHPFMLAFTVALGCDLFDSAAYILYARRGRYLTTGGTMHLNQMEYFPCRCSVCSGKTPDEVRSLPLIERTQFLAQHNLSACLQEIDTIKESIVEGRLWELVEARCRSHPSLLEGLRRINENKSHVTLGAPSTKRKGIFFFDSTSLERPEYVMYLERLVRDYARPKSATTVLLMPVTQQGPRDKVDMRMELANADRGVHVCLYSPPYGLVPSELADAFPFMHTEVSGDPDGETIKAMAETVRVYFASKKAYQSLIVVHSNKRWQKRFARLCGGICRRMDLRFSCRSDRGPLNSRTKKLGNHEKHLDRVVSN